MSRRWSFPCFMAGYISGLAMAMLIVLVGRRLWGTP